MSVDGAPASKPATMVAAGAAIVVAAPAGPGYASRAGHKLAGALETLGVDPAGRHCLDAGAAHGGFTDVLLRRGATRVVAVDVGYGQLDWRLRTDDRVVVLDRTNARTLQPGDLPAPPADLVVADLSFISLRLVLPALTVVAAAAADFLLMVKPQFEVGRGSVGKGGVVRDPALWAGAIDGVVDAAAAQGLGVAGICPSPLPGPSGNIEFFAHLRTGAHGDPAALVMAAVEAGRGLADSMSP